MGEDQNWISSRLHRVRAGSLVLELHDGTWPSRAFKVWKLSFVRTFTVLTGVIQKRDVLVNTNTEL